MKSSTNTSTSLKRGLKILKTLRGHSLNGLSNKEIGDALGESYANVSRILNTLVEEGMAQKLDSGRYAPGMQLLQIAQSFSNEMANTQTRIAEMSQRVLAGSKN